MWKNAPKEIISGCVLWGGKMKQIQWFPGHMAKALREMAKQIAAVDIIIELVDARAPLSSRNPEVGELAKTKPHLLIMTKKDLAEDQATSLWISYFQKLGYQVLAVEVSKLNYETLKNRCLDVLKEKRAKDLAKGLRPRPIRAMVVGIPNVGKSTFINKLAKRKAAVVENRPGVTKSQQYIKVDKDFVLLDTPGVLWPNFEDKSVGVKLALIGTIKQTILPNDVLAFELMSILTTQYPGCLGKHFGIDEQKVINNVEAVTNLERIAAARGFLIGGNQLDIDRATLHVLHEFANGKMGKFSLEQVEDGK